MTKIIDDNMDQDTSTTTAMITTTTRKRRAACDNDNDNSKNTSPGTLINTTSNATNNETGHQPFKRPRIPSQFTRQAERFEEALNKEIQEQEDALRMNEYRMLAVRALENEAHDRAFRDAMDMSSTYQQQQQQYTPSPHPPVAVAASEDMDMDVDGDDYHNPQHEDHHGTREGEGQMVYRHHQAPTVQYTEGDTEPIITTRSGCLTGIIGMNNINPITRHRSNQHQHNNNNNHSTLTELTIYEDLSPDPGGLLSFPTQPNPVGQLHPNYHHYHYNNHHNNQEVRAYHQDWDSDKENINNNIVAGPLHDPVGMITETEAESFSQVVDHSYHNADNVADEVDDEMRMDYEAGGSGGESGRWSSGVPPWRVESESEYADTEVDPDEAGLGLQDYAHRRRRRYHRLRWQSRVLGSQDRGSVASNSSVLVPRVLGESLQDGAGAGAGRGRRGSRRL